MCKEIYLYSVDTKFSHQTSEVKVYIVYFAWFFLIMRNTYAKCLMFEKMLSLNSIMSIAAIFLTSKWLVTSISITHESEV